MRDALFLGISAQSFSQKSGFREVGAKWLRLCQSLGCLGRQYSARTLAAFRRQRNRLARVTATPPPRRRARAAQSGSANPNHAEAPVLSLNSFK